MVELSPGCSSATVMVSREIWAKMGQNDQNGPKNQHSGTRAMSMTTDSKAGLWNQRAARSKLMLASEEQWFLPNTPEDWRSKKLTVRWSRDFRPLGCAFARCCCRVASHAQPPRLLRFGPKWTKSMAQRRRIILVPCHYIFTSSSGASA